MREKNWCFLFGANFLGVFNDNFLKHAIIFVSMSWYLPDWLTSSQVIAAVSAALIVPYLIFSPLSGKISLKYGKKYIFKTLKLFEIPLMIFAVVAFYFQWIFAAILIVFFMGILSCLYSPAKYALIRDIGGVEKASYGSGMIEAMAFMGILLGTVGASLLSDRYNVSILAFILLGVAIGGYLFTTLIQVKEQPIKSKEKENFLAFFIQNFRFAKKQPLMFPAIIGYAIFWAIAGLLQMNIIIYGKNILTCSNSITGVIMACAAIGIIAGCTVAGKLTTQKNQRLLVLIATFAMSLIMLIIVIFVPKLWFFAVLITLFAFSGGFFQVPCLTTIQQADIGQKLPDIIAFLNFLTFVFVLIATLLFAVVNLISNENSIIIFGIMLIISLFVVLYLLTQINK